MDRFNIAKKSRTTNTGDGFVQEQLFLCAKMFVKTTVVNDQTCQDTKVLYRLVWAVDGNAAYEKMRTAWLSEEGPMGSEGYFYSRVEVFDAIE